MDSMTVRFVCRWCGGGDAGGGDSGVGETGGRVRVVGRAAVDVGA